MSRAARRRRGRPLSHARYGVLSLVVAALAYSTMQMMIVPALPAMQRDLAAEPDDIAWLISAFLASTAVASPLAGRFGDLYGKRGVLVFVLAVFSSGGVLGVVASSVEVLVVARALQGVGGAVFPLAYGIAKDIVPSARVPTTIGLISGSFGVGGSLGLVLSGPLVDHVAWQATVGLGAVLGAAAAACVHRFVPATAPGRRVPLDVGGGLLLVAGLVPLLLGIAGHAVSSSTSGRLFLIGAGAGVLALWAIWESRRPAPLVDVRLLRRRTVWPVNVAGAAIGFGMFATGFLVPQLVQADPARADVGFGGSVTTTSLYLLPALVSSLAAGPAAGMLGRRRGSALPLLLGMVAMGIGYGALSLGVESSLAVATATLVAHGVGLNFALAAMANLIIEEAPAARSAESAGVNATVRTIGGAIGIQIVAIVMLAPSGVAGELSARGFQLAFGLCAALMAGAVAILMAMQVARGGRRDAVR